MNVLLGSSAGLTASGNRQWHQAVPGVLGQAEKDDGFGAALAAGDFNGDGFADLAVGVPGEDLELESVGLVGAAGAVGVLYGSSVALTPSGNQLWHQDVPGIAGRAEAQDHFGSVLAAGDFTKDGFAELAIGVPREGLELGEDGTIPAVGAVNVLAGSREIVDVFIGTQGRGVWRLSLKYLRDSLVAPSNQPVIR